MIYRVIYVSNAKRGMGESEVAKILESSRRHNAAGGVTGLLVFHENRFFQVLEGEREVVRNIYKRIHKDQRHTAVRLVSEEMAEARAFPKWQMGYARPDELPTKARDAAFSIYNMVSANSPERGDDDRVRLFVRSFLASLDELRKQPAVGGAKG